MVSAYTVHTKFIEPMKCLILKGIMVGTGGFEAIAPFIGSNKFNNLQPIKRSSIAPKRLKKPVSAYTVHTAHIWFEARLTF